MFLPIQMHHGGAGTTSAGLRAGKPTVIHPFFGDQWFWASRVTDLGVGVGVRKMDATTISDALRLVTSDSKIINRAHAIGEKIRSENGPATAVKIIHRDVEYQQRVLQREAFRRLSMLDQPETDGRDPQDPIPRSMVQDRYSASSEDTTDADFSPRRLARIRKLAHKKSSSASSIFAFRSRHQ